MKSVQYLVIISFLISGVGCGTKTEHGHQDEGNGTESTNDALYDEVMRIHDEVMPKMNDLYKIKEELKKQLAETTNLTEEKRRELEAQLAKVEEASKGMMVWMREFNPPADSLGEKVVNEYLKEQLEAVKKVKENIQQALPAAQ